MPSFLPSFSPCPSISIFHSWPNFFSPPWVSPRCSPIAPQLKEFIHSSGVGAGPALPRALEIVEGNVRWHRLHRRQFYQWLRKPPSPWRDNNPAEQTPISHSLTMHSEGAGNMATTADSAASSTGFACKEIFFYAFYFRQIIFWLFWTILCNFSFA